MLAATPALYANPWWQFGWVELAASIGPLCLGLGRRIHREVVFAVGLPGIVLLCILDPTAPIVPRAFVAIAVFLVGVSVTSRMISGLRDRESIPGLIDIGPPKDRALEEFKRAAEKEFGRARRHERSLAVLSLTANPRTAKVNGPRSNRDDLARKQTASRAHRDLSALLTRELHIYSDVVATQQRVLALVPELEGAAAEPLVKRLQSVITRELDFDIRIGVACFPRDAICVDNLISAADLDRAKPRLQGVPDRSAPLGVDQPDDLDREVQG
jgi:hypothetical protein